MMIYINNGLFLNLAQITHIRVIDGDEGSEIRITMSHGKVLVLKEKEEMDRFMYGFTRNFPEVVQEYANIENQKRAEQEGGGQKKRGWFS